MATLSQVVAPRMAFLGNDGKPASGYRLFTYAAGTTNKVTTYTGVSGTTPNTNPIVLDARGECDVWALPGLRLRLELYPPGFDDPPTQSLAIWTGSSNAQPDGILGIPDLQISEWLPYFFAIGDVCFSVGSSILYIRGNVLDKFTLKRRLKISTQVGSYYATITNAQADINTTITAKSGDFNQSIVNINGWLTSLTLSFDRNPAPPNSAITEISYGLFGANNTSIPKIDIGTVDKALKADEADNAKVADQAKDFLPASNLEKSIITPGGRRIAAAFSRGVNITNDETWSRYINLGSATFTPLNGSIITTLQIVFPKRSRYFAIDLVIGSMYGGPEMWVDLRGIATATESTLTSCRVFGGTNTLDVKFAAPGISGINGEDLTGRMAFSLTLPAGGWINGATINVDDYEEVADQGTTYYNPRIDGPIDVAFGVMPTNNVGWNAAISQDLFTQKALDDRYKAKPSPTIDIVPSNQFNQTYLLNAAQSAAAHKNENSGSSYYELPKPIVNYVGKSATYIFDAQLANMTFNISGQDIKQQILRVMIPGVSSDTMVMGGGGSSGLNLDRSIIVIPTMIDRSKIGTQQNIIYLGGTPGSISNTGPDTWAYRFYITFWFMN